MHDISIEIGGERFEGCWYIVLGDMVVYYDGQTAKTPLSKANVADTPWRMLRELVEKYYTRLDSISLTIPQAVRLSARELVNTGFRLGNARREEAVTAKFVMSFGESVAGSLVHQQLSWLCINAVSLIVPAWKHLCDGNAAEETFESLRRWLQDPTQTVDWSSAVQPAVALRAGIRVGDCDTCRLELIADAVASSARYLQSADSAEATATLLSATWAYEEGCHPQDAPERFEKRLIHEVLPAAIECQPLP